MKGELVPLLKTIGIYDLIIGIIISIFLSIFFKGEALLFLFGISLGFINFLINSYATRRIVHKKDKLGVLTIILSLLIRVSLICGPAIVILMKSEVGFFIFISGYISQILSIVGYGVCLRRQEV